MSILRTCFYVVLATTAAAVAALGLLLSHTDRLVRTAVPRLGRLCCPRCGGVIGDEVATAAAAAREIALRELRERAGAGVRFRLDPHWRFPCPSCRAPLKFDPGASRSALTTVEA